MPRYAIQVQDRTNDIDGKVQTAWHTLDEQSAKSRRSFLRACGAPHKFRNEFRQFIMKPISGIIRQLIDQRKQWRCVKVG